MNQEYSDLLLIFIIIILFFLVIYLLFKNKSSTSIQENDTINVQKNISEIQGSIILLTKTVEEKINNINKNIGSSLNEQTEKTQKSLSDVRERLAVIDKAQNNLNELSAQVHSLKNILSNKQLRGAFGEVQLENLIRDSLPQNAYKFQHTLKNGFRVDCMVNLPYPPGPICIDSKFPLEHYRSYVVQADKNEILDENIVKCAASFKKPKPKIGEIGNALYFSRCPIPWGNSIKWHHLGIYGWDRSIIEKYIKLKPSNLEMSEKLEQLRALEAGINIKILITNEKPIGIDTISDLKKFKKSINAY
mgnify:CR=1 FL=1